MYRRQTIRQSGDFVGENEGLGPTPSNGAEFHQGLIVKCSVETDRHVLGLVLLYEEYASEQDPLGIEGGIGRQVVTDVGWFRGGQLLLLDLMQHNPLGAGSNTDSTV